MKTIRIQVKVTEDTLERFKLLSNVSGLKQESLIKKMMDISYKDILSNHIEHLQEVGRVAVGDLSVEEIEAFKKLLYELGYITEYEPQHEVLKLICQEM